MSAGCCPAVEVLVVLLTFEAGYCLLCLRIHSLCDGGGTVGGGGDSCGPCQLIGKMNFYIFFSTEGPLIFPQMVERLSIFYT